MNKVVKKARQGVSTSVKPAAARACRWSSTLVSG
jgi:hypothetical protein